MHLLLLISQAAVRSIRSLRLRVGNFMSAVTKRGAGRVVFMKASDFQSFRRHATPPTRFIYSMTQGSYSMVAAVTGTGTVVVVEETPRAALFTVFEQVRNGAGATPDVILVGELDTTVEDHYGGVLDSYSLLDTTLDDSPEYSMLSPISEVILSAGVPPAKVLPFHHG